MHLASFRKGHSSSTRRHGKLGVAAIQNVRRKSRTELSRSLELVGRGHATGMAAADPGQ